MAVDIGKKMFQAERKASAGPAGETVPEEQEKARMPEKMNLERVAGPRREGARGQTHGALVGVVRTSAWQGEMGDTGRL